MNSWRIIDLFCLKHAKVWWKFTRFREMLMPLSDNQLVYKSQNAHTNERHLIVCRTFLGGFFPAKRALSHDCNIIVTLFISTPCTFQSYTSPFSIGARVQPACRFSCIQTQRFLSCEALHHMANHRPASKKSPK